MFVFCFFFSGYLKAAFLAIQNREAEGTKHGENFRCCHYRYTKPGGEQLSELLCKELVNCVSPAKKFMLQSPRHIISQITASFYLCTLNNSYSKLHLVSTEG